MYKKFLVLSLGGLLTIGSVNTLSAAASDTPVPVQHKLTTNDLIGRWDITMDEDGKSVPSWLEVKLSGYSTLTGYFVGASGSARPIAKVNFNDGKFSFTIPPQWEKGNQDFVIEGELNGKEIQGTLVTSEGKNIGGRSKGSLS